MKKMKQIALLCFSVAVLSLTAQDLSIESGSKKAEPSSVQILKIEDSKPKIKKIKQKRAIADANISDYANRSFYGGVVYMSSWADMGITEVPYGLHCFDIKSNGSVYSTEKVTLMAADWIASCRLRNHYYGVRPISMFGVLTGASYQELNLDNYTVGRSRMIDTDVSYALLPAGMFVDVTDGNLYGIMYNEDLTGLNIAKFDPSDMSFEVISKFGGKFNVMAITSAPDGKIYLINPEGDLYSLNKNNGKVSLIDNTGVNVAAYTQAMTWDSQTNKLLWSAVTPTGTKLYAVDPETAETLYVAKLRNAPQLSGMYMAEDGQMPAAPKTVSDFKIKYDYPGALEGVLTFTLPTTDGSGSTLNTPLTVSLWRDGEVLKDAEEMTAGEVVSIPMILTNANHHFALSVKNEHGYAPMSIIYEWAGLDYPSAPQKVKLTVENNISSLSWEAPKGTANGGYMDDEGITYRVVRMPDNIVVSESQSETTFSEQMPKAVRRYSYKVMALNGTNKVGAEAESNYVVAGEAYEVPYSENWEEGEAAKELFVVVNNDADNATWMWADWNFKWLLFTPQAQQSNDDWLISPCVSLEEGKVYNYKINVRNSVNGSPETFAVAYGTDSEDLSTFIRFGEWSVDGAYDQDLECSFKVEKTGDYHLALISTTNQTKGSSVVLNSMGVDYIGMANAPNAVSELVITPDPDEKPIATIDFVAPLHNLNGEPLQDKISVNIYRNDLQGVLATIENIEPGSVETWIDETNPTPGRHTYTLRAVNESGEGMPISKTVFVGVYQAPWSQPCLSRECLQDFTLVVDGYEEEPIYPSLKFNAYGDPMLELTHYNLTEDEHDLWIMLPKIKFEDESVYSFKFNMKHSGYINDKILYSVNIGNEPTIEAQTKELSILPTGTNYNFEMQEIPVVVTDGGNKYLSIRSKSENYQDYIYTYYKDFTLERVGSALAPDSVTNLSATSELTSKILFNAPTVDYAGRELKEITKIEIFRNNNPIAVHVFENSVPGELIEWIDEGAILGMNSYEIVASNSYGSGRSAKVKAYIGYDTPSVPTEVSIVPTDDNQSAIITWQPVKRGLNGGVLSEEFSYKVVELSVDNDGLLIETIEENIKETTYHIERKPTEEQQLIYYGVIASTPQGDSEPGFYFTILGKPYELPFEESFANGRCSTALWIAMHPEGALQSGPTVEEASVTMGVTPQDGDKGCFFFLNGAYSDYRSDIPVFTPKVTLGDAENPEVSFWLYKGNHSGECEAPEFKIYACYNEGEMELLGTEIWNETTPQWVRYAYSLKDYKGLSGTLLFQLVASANIYLDFIAMDNFKVTATPGTGIDDVRNDKPSVFGVVGGILTRNAMGETVEVFMPNGQKVVEYLSEDKVFPIEKGIYVIKVGSQSTKVVVR